MCVVMSLPEGDQLFAFNHESSICVPIQVDCASDRHTHDNSDNHINDNINPHHDCIDGRGDIDACELRYRDKIREQSNNKTRRRAVTQGHFERPLSNRRNPFFLQFFIFDIVGHKPRVRAEM